MKKLNNWLEENREFTSCLLTALFVISLYLLAIGILIK